ncbi:hypothetical protein TRICI_001035 [Trichomonascus ciferrii]|uniref:Retrotransposon gag domain-containing protein n=1 Tax=Trichomonascus ciferrii TaxID=44093 RepID=A0A642VBS8_9ASCO|nr:hypothetical protein TRICI_001035 [Trichomonascus ciferrii]
MKRGPDFIAFNPPPKFNPDKEDAECWLVEFLAHCQEKNLYGVDRTTMAIICMDGKAADWICRIMHRGSGIPMEDIIVDPKVIPEWTDFVKAFISRFIPDDAEKYSVLQEQLLQNGSSIDKSPGALMK